MARTKPTKTTAATEVMVPVSPWRYRFVGVFFAILLLGMAGRAVHLQVIDNDYLQSQGDARYLRVQKNLPTRGMITDRNGQPLAVSTPVDSIWMHPPTILSQKDKVDFKLLSKLLGVTREEILQKAEARKTREFVYLKRHLPPQQANKILSLNVPGINSVREYRRYYPSGPMVGHVLGFTNIDNEGQEGLELAYNKELKGQAGRTLVMRDKMGRVVEHVEQLAQVRHGKDLRLSIDARIQYLAYRHLQAAVKKNKASSASLVALDVRSGEILAMVSMPDFNPNDRKDLKSSRFRNRSIADSYEPGSTVKPLVMAMALQEEVVESSSMIDAEQGHFYIGKSRINDTKPLGLISAAQVVSKSSNIGSAKVAMKLPAKQLYETYKDLGFGSTNSLIIPGEQKGILAKRRKWRPIEHATMSYGYGLSANTLQIARAYQALANEGVLLPVSLTPLDKAPKGERVFDAEITHSVATMLEMAVSDEGTAPEARVAQYRVGGKTGTAHKIKNGQYQEDNYLSLFAGYAPISDPRIVIVVCIDDPQGIDYYGGLVAAPVFSKVMEGALRFSDVAPDGDTAPDFEQSAPKLMIARPVAGVSP